MRRWSFLACLAALSAVAPQVQAQSSDVLRIGIRDDPDLLDPTFSRTYVGTVVMTALCDKQRRAAYQGVWQQESKDLPIIYLWTPRNIVGLSRKVAGFSFLADGLLRLQDVRPAR